MDEPWWRRVDEAAQLVVSMITPAGAGRDGSDAPPPGEPEPRRRRKAGSLRHLAEVIKANRLAPGVVVGKDNVAGVLAGDLRYVTDSTSVVAVARASHLISGEPFSDEDAARLAAACQRLATLVEEAKDADHRASVLTSAFPSPPAAAGSRSAALRSRAAEAGSVGGGAQPVFAGGESASVPGRSALAPGRPDSAAGQAPPEAVGAYSATRRPRSRRWLLTSMAVALAGATTGVVLLNREPADAACREGAVSVEILDDASRFFQDDLSIRLDPALDFDSMNGSAHYQAWQGRTYYWGRAGSDNQAPESGGARVRWRTADGPWHSCAVALPADERGYVHTAAVPTTIGGAAVTIQVCLWRDTPRRENCTPAISAGL